ncbi:hydroxypyruvate isomerase, partial [Streptomyces sp. NPDC059849]
YDGWVGLEYKPGDRPSAEAFEWLPATARAAR